MFKPTILIVVVLFAGVYTAPFLRHNSSCMSAVMNAYGDFNKAVADYDLFGAFDIANDLKECAMDFKNYVSKWGATDCNAAYATLWTAIITAENGMASPLSDLSAIKAALTDAQTYLTGCISASNATCESELNKINSEVDTVKGDLSIFGIFSIQKDLTALQNTWNAFSNDSNCVDRTSTQCAAYWADIQNVIAQLKTVDTKNPAAVEKITNTLKPVVSAWAAQCVIH